MDEIKITTTVTRSRVADLICGGMEGGIFGVPSWARTLRYVSPPEVILAAYKKDGTGALALGGDWEKKGESGEIYQHIHYPMCLAGGGVLLYDCDVNEDDAYSSESAFEPVLFDYKRVIHGLGVMSRTEPRHFGDWINENDDAITGSVFVQCAVFGEVTFG
ncbi:MAG: hypothetical protein HRT76_13590 [Halieaceae bacterium]|nr:hypothetical protein [Halieaceae bacterium]